MAEDIFRLQESSERHFAQRRHPRLWYFLKKICVYIYIYNWLEGKGKK